MSYTTKAKQSWVVKISHEPITKFFFKFTIFLIFTSVNTWLRYTWRLSYTIHIITHASTSIFSHFSRICIDICSSDALSLLDRLHFLRSLPPLRQDQLSACGQIESFTCLTSNADEEEGSSPRVLVSHFTTLFFFRWVIFSVTSHNGKHFTQFFKSTGGGVKICRSSHMREKTRLRDINQRTKHSYSRKKSTICY